MTPPGEFPNNSAQPHLALWLDSPVVQSGLALRLDLRDLRKAHFLKPIRNGFRPRVYLVLAYARHSTVASPLDPAAAGLLITLIAVGPRPMRQVALAAIARFEIFRGPLQQIQAQSHFATETRNIPELGISCNFIR